MKSLIIIATLASLLSVQANAESKRDKAKPSDKVQKENEKAKSSLDLAASQAKIEQHDKFMEAIVGCFQDNSLVQPAPGEKLSDADKAILDECLKSKGIEVPKRNSKK